MPVCDGGIGPARLNRPLLYVDEHPHRCPMKRSTERPLLGSVRCIGDWLVLAGQRPLTPTGAGHSLYFGLLGHFQSVIDLDAEITNRTLQLRVS